MTSREQALSQIVALAEAHGITAKDIAQALQKNRPAQSHNIATRLFSYLGGIFIFAGIATAVGMFWGDMNSAMRVIITLGSGFALFFMGIASLRDPRYGKAVAPLFVLAALLQPPGLFVAIHEYFHSGSDPRYAALFVFGFMGIQQGFTFVSLKHGALAFFSLAFGTLFFATAFDLIGVDDDWIGIVIGASLLCISYGLSATTYRGFTPFWYFVGSIALFCGAFDVLKNVLGGVFYLALTCLMIYVSVTVRSTTLLVTSAIAMIWFIGYFTAQHFVNSVGWPIALILFGLALLGIGVGAVRLRKKYF